MDLEFTGSNKMGQFKVKIATVDLSNHSWVEDKVAEEQFNNYINCFS